MTESPEDRPRPKPGPGKRRPKPEREDVDCPVCFAGTELDSVEACGVVFSLLRALASGDDEFVGQAHTQFAAFDGHIALHVAYIFLYNLCVLTDQHPLDLIDMNQDVIRESLAAG